MQKAPDGRGGTSFSFFPMAFAFQNPPMDQTLEIFINREWTSPWADRLMAFVADYGAWAPWLLLFLVAGAVFGDFRFRAMLLSAGLAVGLSDGIGVNILKHAVGRARPSQVEPGVRVVTLGAPVGRLPKICGVFSDPSVSYPHGERIPEVREVPSGGPPVQGRSFPSGHAANNMAVAIVLLCLYPRRGWLYLPVALLIGYSRIYTGSHWPTDVLGGWALGALGGWLAVRALEWFIRRFGKGIPAASLGLLGRDGIPPRS